MNDTQDTIRKTPDDVTLKNIYRCLYAVTSGSNWRGPYIYKDVHIAGLNNGETAQMAEIGNAKVIMGWKDGTEHVICELYVDGKLIIREEVYVACNEADKWRTAVADVWMKACMRYEGVLL